MLAPGPLPSNAPAEIKTECYQAYVSELEKAIAQEEYAKVKHYPEIISDCMAPGPRQSKAADSILQTNNLEDRPQALYTNLGINQLVIFASVS